METKKSPRYDVHRLSGRFFLIGLVISISLAITAFQWRTVKKVLPPPEPDVILSSDMQVIPDVLVIPKPQPIVSKPKQKVVQMIPIETTAQEPTDPTPPEITIDPTPIIVAIDSIPKETGEEIHLFPEVGPKPTGGYDAFYDFVAKSMRYPKTAQRNHTQGKVFIEFVVDRTGTVSQLKIVKGIGDGCDEEAMRVISQTRWEPGRQRGKPVNVRLTLPVQFKLE